MEDNYDYPFGLRESIEEYCPNSEKNTDNENNRNEEQKNVNTYVNNINNNNNNSIVINNYNPNSNINCFNNYNNSNFTHGNIKNDIENIYNIYFNHEKQNPPYNLGDEFQTNFQNYIEQNDNKKTLYSSNINANNGKPIYTLNEAVYGVFNEIFNTTEINLENKKDMQFLKKKKRRRTKVEIEKEKEKEKIFKSDEEKKKRKLGRKKKLGNEKSDKLKCHSKISDDNIMKKINSYFLESIRNWLNKSFINEEGSFYNLNERKKSKKKMFLKIDPKIITTNLKRKSVINTMNMQFKDIFSNDVSKKYSKINANENRILIDEIYQNQNQFFIIFILELKFIEAFNYFNGQNKMEDLKPFFYGKIFDINMILRFLGNLDKIDKFLKRIYDNQNKNCINKEETHDYLQRIALLCLNYKEWFENKYNRRENKNKNKKNNDSEKNN